ncbi:MAG: anti-sigma factor [Betaproteobacteria bacterium]
MKPKSINENELHAYVDRHLPENERQVVDCYLSEHPGEAERIRDYQQQNLALKALFNPVLDEPLPEHLLSLAVAPPVESISPARNALFHWSLQRLAAGLFIALVGGAAGWLAHDQRPQAETVASSVPLPRQAAIAHAVFTPDVRRPVEVSGQQEEQLVAWLSKRLGTPVKPPKLGALGYELVGGRLLPGNIGPVAQFMYQDSSGQRLTLFLSTENTSNQNTAFRFAQEGQVKVFYWIDGKFGYALSGTLDKGELARLATAVYDQIEGK